MPHSFFTRWFLFFPAVLHSFFCAQHVSHWVYTQRPYGLLMSDTLGLGTPLFHLSECMVVSSHAGS